MGDKIINVTLRKVADKDSLVFHVSKDNEILLDLNSDDQDKLKELFYIIIQDLMDNNVSLELEIGSDYDVALFKEIATEYIDALNKEIKTVKQSIPTKQ